MKRIVTPTVGPCEWRVLLRDPENQWQRNRSAFELAISWEIAQQHFPGRGLPRETADVLDTVDSLKNAELLLAFPEHKVALNTRRAPSQNDIWALLRNERGLLSLSVEGKAGEPFDETVSKWLNKDKKRAGRLKRLKWLCRVLKTDDAESTCGPLRYQLFHRTVSALKEAERFGAFAAIMIVQAFPGAEASRKDFQRFCKYLGINRKPESDSLLLSPNHIEPELYMGWATSQCSSETEIAAAISK